MCYDLYRKETGPLVEVIGNAYENKDLLNDRK